MENKCKNCGSKSKNSKCPHSINYEHDFDNINIQEEISKMSDEEFISEINASGLYFEAKDELRKRLSKNNIEEFIFRIKNYMEKHDKIGLTYTEISNFDYFEKMSKEELEDIENGKFNN